MANTVKVSEFKAKCLKLLTEVAETGEELVITKRGKVLARVVPERNQKPSSLQGAMKGLIEVLTPDRILPRADATSTPTSTQTAATSPDVDGERRERLVANLSPLGRHPGAED